MPICRPSDNQKLVYSGHKYQLNIIDYFCIHGSYKYIIVCKAISDFEGLSKQFCDMNLLKIR